MIILDLVAVVLGISALAYLLVALVRPERF